MTYTEQVKKEYQQIVNIINNADISESIKTVLLFIITKLENIEDKENK